MARFRLMTTHIGPDGRRLRALSTIADNFVNVLGADVVWPGLNSQSVSPTMLPLDAAATSMQQDAVRFWGLRPVTTYGPPDGVDSVG
jgi:hypothetical protein